MHKNGVWNAYMSFPKKVRVHKKQTWWENMWNVQKLSPIHTSILEMEEIGNADGEVVHWSQIV